MKRKTKQFILISTVLLTGMQATACSLTTICPTPEPCPRPEPCLTPEPCPTQMVEPSIVGTWEGSLSTSTITFRFEEDGDFIYLMNGSELDRGQYATLNTIDPPGLIFVFNDGTVLYPIYTFLDKDTLQLENSLPDQPRPAGFSDYLIMTRFIP